MVLPSFRASGRAVLSLLSVTFFCACPGVSPAHGDSAHTAAAKAGSRRAAAKVEKRSTKHTSVSSAPHVTFGLSHSNFAPRADRYRGNATSSAERNKEQREEKESGEWKDAYLFFYKQRAFPNKTMNLGAYRRGAMVRDGLPAAHLRPISSTPTNTGKPLISTQAAGRAVQSASLQAVANPSPRWEFLGPRNMALPSRWSGPNPAAGRVNAVAYASTGVMYAGSSSGGVWKTTNGGFNWIPLTDGWPTLSVSSIAVDPKNPNKVYVGTGDFQGYQVYPFGLMRSTDGGATWTNSGQAQFGDTPVSHIVVDPESPNIITISTGHFERYSYPQNPHGYVWRSTDSGQTWTKAFDSSNVWSGLAISLPNTSGVRAYYAVGLGQIYRSLDRGVTWTSLPLPSGATLGSPPDIATSKVSTTGVYLLSPNDPGFGFPGDQKVYKSTDGGNTWADITSNLATQGDWSQSSYDYYINIGTCLDRRRRVQDAIYVGLIDLHQSIDGGQSWRSIGYVYSNSALLHPDQHCMAINPNDPTEAFVGCDGGLYRMMYNPRRDWWTVDPTPNVTLGITEFYHGAFNPGDPTKMLGGTQDNSTPVSLGDLASWGNVAGGDGGAAEIHPLLPGIQYATVYYGQIDRTTDNWRTNSWYFLPDYTDFIWPITIDPQDPQILYGGGSTLWRFTFPNAPYYFIEPLAPILSQYGVLESISVSPSDSNYIYCGSSSGEVFVTPDGGTTWREIDQGATSLPTRYVSSIAVNPDDPKRIVVALSGTGAPHIWRCDDTSAASPVWYSASNGLPDVPTNTVALDLTDPANTYYVGTDIGVFVTQDGGSSWSNMTQPLGLPNVRVDELRATYGTGYLNAATYGRGMWRLHIANPVAPISRVSSIPTSPHGGKPITLVITLLAPAPRGGQAVTLQSSNPAVVKVPSTPITVVAGYNIVQVPVNTGAVTTKTTVTVSASAGGKTRSVDIVVVP